MNIVALVLLRAWSALVRKFRVMGNTALSHTALGQRGSQSQVRRSVQLLHDRGTQASLGSRDRPAGLR